MRLGVSSGSDSRVWICLQSLWDPIRVLSWPSTNKIANGDAIIKLSVNSCTLLLGEGISFISALLPTTLLSDGSTDVNRNNKNELWPFHQHLCRGQQPCLHTTVMWSLLFIGTRPVTAHISAKLVLFQHICAVVMVTQQWRMLQCPSTLIVLTYDLWKMKGQSSSGASPNFNERFSGPLATFPGY